MPLYLEFTLPYLITHAGVGPSRLDGFERVLTALARMWRPEQPLAPAREVRMADETREALLAWVEEEGVGSTRALERLAVYASGAVTDDSVPEGWVRLQLSRHR